MKSKSLKIVGALVLMAIAVVSFSSCKSTKVEEPNPYFLADMDAIYMGDLVALNKQNFFKPKAINIEVFFYPRTSSVGMFFRDAVNKVALTFSPEEFELLKASVLKYDEIATADSFVKNYKPSKKNSFNAGKVHIGWGLTGYSREVEAPYTTNYEWLEVQNVVNPYFRLQLKPADYPEEENVASPTVSLYFTPSQAKAITTVVNMEEVLKQVEEFNKAAYSFE